MPREGIVHFFLLGFVCLFFFSCFSGTLYASVEKGSNPQMKVLVMHRFQVHKRQHSFKGFMDSLCSGKRMHLPELTKTGVLLSNVDMPPSSRS